MPSSLGPFVGGLVHGFAAALGLSAILAASAVAFHTVKYAGAAYLIWLGIRTIRTRNAEMTLQAPGPSNGAFRQGILTEVLNPKTALFFLSFIPQFVAPAHGHAFFQFALLGAISVSLNTDRKSTRLNSSHGYISYAVFCLKKKKKKQDKTSVKTNKY